MSTRGAPPSAVLQPGATFSHYRVDERIGGGGMGTVYRARDMRLGRDVAIKVINADIAGDPDRLARFHREANTVATLNHPGIVTIHDTGVEQGTTFIVTELVDGTTVRALLERERTVGYRRLIDIGSQVADALAAAHGAGITHRDVKPENLMLTRDGRVKLLDFGLAQSHGREADQGAATTALHTGAGVVLGTLGYMSPEQVRGESLDPRSDIFSLGVVLYELASGLRPFSGATTADVSSAVLREDPPPLPGSVPATLRVIIERCLNKAPLQRFQSASDLAFALRSIGDRPSVIQDTVVPVPPSRSRARLATALILLAGGLVALAAYRVMTAVDAAALVRLRPFATEAHGEAQPVWSPDGRSIAYVIAVDGKQQMVVKSLGTPSPASVLQCPVICDTVAWSVDGSRIFYQSRTSHLDARLWSVARTGGEPAPVFKSDVQVLASALSPDGKQLAVLRVIAAPDGVGKRYGLFLSSPPGADPVRFEPFALEHLVTPTRLAWSRDSTRMIVYTSNPPRTHMVRPDAGQITVNPAEGRTDVSFSADPTFAVVAQPSIIGARTGLQWLDTGTGRLAPLIPSESVLSYPAVSPDGATVAYVANEVDYDLVEIPLDGSPVRPLLASRLAEHSVQYSPRMSELVYVAGGDAPEIRVRQPATLAERVVVSQSDFSGQSGASSFGAAAFSPDGTKLAYNRNFEIWISPSNGGAPAKLTQTNGEFGPEWSPDGAWIAFNYAQPTFGGLVKVRVGAAEDVIRLREGMCGAVAPAWSPDGAWIACGHEATGLELVPAGGGPPRSLGTQYEPLAVWSRDPGRLYVVRAAEGRRQIGELTWRTGAFRRIGWLPADFEISNAMSWGGRLSLSYDGTSLVTAIVRSTGDIWLLEGLRPPRAWWQRLVGG
jgi:serine/threonine protein kinase/Tol biopolymer transport system component